MSRVLVVDDSTVDMELACGLLEGDAEIVRAGNGAEALAAMAAGEFDLVLTDLQMPVMDGLELVKEGTSRFPGVPIVLMTAHGSEEIAAEALKRGAASYVPKRYLVQNLPEVIAGILSVGRAKRSERRAIECLARSVHEYVVDNEPSTVQALMGVLQQQASRRGVSDEGGLTQLGIALTEALSNAIHHGNLEVDSELREHSVGDYFDKIEKRRSQEPYCNRRVNVKVTITAEEAVYVIRDDGPGFDLDLVPDPTAAENLEKPSGRGLMLIRTFMDEVRHNPKGNEITMTKRRP